MPRSFWDSKPDCPPSVLPLPAALSCSLSSEPRQFDRFPRYAFAISGAFYQCCQCCWKAELRAVVPHVVLTSGQQVLAALQLNFSVLLI